IRRREIEWWSGSGPEGSLGRRGRRVDHGQRIVIESHRLQGETILDPDLPGKPPLRDEKSNYGRPEHDDDPGKFIEPGKPINRSGTLVPGDESRHHRESGIADQGRWT